MNLVKEIAEYKNSEWRYCPTTDNLADLVTREISSEQHKESMLLTKGPDWLTDQSRWPENITSKMVLTKHADNVELNKLRMVKLK